MPQSLNPIDPRDSWKRVASIDSVKRYLGSQGVEASRLNELASKLVSIQDPSEQRITEVLGSYASSHADAAKNVARIISSKEKTDLIPPGQYAFNLNPDYVRYFDSDKGYKRVIEQLSRVYSDVNSVEAQRAAGILMWVLNELYLDIQPALEIARHERVRGSAPKLGEYLDVLKKALSKLEPSCEFNLERFGEPQEEFDPLKAQAINQAMLEEIFIPNGLFGTKVGRANKLDMLAFIDPNSCKMLSPFGREVSVLFLHPFRQNLGSINFISDYVFLPTNYVETNNGMNQSLVRNYDVYSSDKRARAQVDFRRNDQVFMPYFGWQYAGMLKRNGLNIDIERLNDDLVEILAMADIKKLAEKKLKRRFNDACPEDYAEAARLVTKSTSPLYTMLIPSEDTNNLEDDSMAVTTLLGKLISITRCNSALLQFADGIFTEVSDLDAVTLLQEQKHLLIARRLFTRLVGPKIDRGLDFGLEFGINKRAWREWGQRSFLGRQLNKEQEEIERFDGQLRTEIAPELIDEHFKVDFDSIQPGWRDFVP